MVKDCDHKIARVLETEEREFFLTSMLLIHPKLLGVVDFSCFDTGIDFKDPELV